MNACTTTQGRHSSGWLLNDTLDSSESEILRSPARDGVHASEVDRVMPGYRMLMQMMVASVHEAKEEGG
jgi:hypothetical protein